MNSSFPFHIAPLLAEIDDRIVGKWIFTAVFAVLLLWLLLIPARRLGDDEGKTTWWRSTRVWAIVIAAVQMVVYAVWG